MKKTLSILRNTAESPSPFPVKLPVNSVLIHSIVTLVFSNNSHFVALRFAMKVTLASNHVEIPEGGMSFVFPN